MGGEIELHILDKSGIIKEEEFEVVDEDSEGGNKEEEEREIRDLMLLPLEYIYSLVQL